MHHSLMAETATKTKTKQNKTKQSVLDPKILST
jgi:hypothetical protein